MMLFYYIIGPATNYLLQRLSGKNKNEMIELNEDLIDLRAMVNPVLDYVNTNYKGINKYKMFVLFMVTYALNEHKKTNG